MNPTVNTCIANEEGVARADATSQKEILFEEFQSPSAAFRGKPFWSWNGTLEKAELLRQLRVFKEMGMGGAFMHSRTGLKTEYLGEEWFDLINVCADECEKLGLEAWLYDEDRWPSGSAGGMATENREFRLKALQLTVVDPAELRWPDKETFVAAFAADLDGLNLGSYTPLEYGAPIASPHPGKVLIFTIEETIEHSFYNGNTYLDTLNRKATEHFLEVTHEKYREHCGDRLGKSIKGIFTDEPHHGLVMCHNDEQRTRDNPFWSVPYTEALFGEFEKRWGYDLRPRLPELFLWPQGRRVSQVKWHYMELLQQLFLDNWAKPCLEWCREHNLLLTGHVLHEDSLVAQAVPCGSVMRYYEFLDYPGVDLLCDNNRSYWVVKQLQSAARQFGKKWLLSELYGCTGWQFDFASHKETGFWQALFGVNLRCHHLAWVTMAGEAKRDFPASISFQSGWYREYKTVEDYFSRLHVVLQQGKPVCDVLVLNPIESVWAQIHPGWAQWLGAKDPILRALEEKYEELFRWLVGAQIDFDYGDEDHLARISKIETGAGEPLLRLGQSIYRVVVVGAMETIRSTTLKVLEDFHAAGGKLIFVGDAPPHLDALPSEKPAELARTATRSAHCREEVLAAIEENSASPVKLQCISSSIFCQVRREENRLFIVAINTSRSETVHHVQFTVDGLGSVQEWECETGARFRQPSTIEDRATVWTVHFSPLATRVFVVSEWDSGDLPARPCFVSTGSIPAEGPFEYTLNEPNLCVLDFASYRLGDEPWHPEMEILQIDSAVRSECGLPQRAGDMVQPWAATKLGLHAAVETTPLALRFEFEADTLPSAPVELVMETPERFEIRLNGKLIEVPCEPEWIIDPCLKRIPLSPDAIRHGNNQIELATAFAPDVNLEAIYLAGSFGVSLRENRPVLGVLPEKLYCSDVTTQGLPFYSGTISYRIPIPAPAEPESVLRIETGEFGGALLKVRFDESTDATAIAWPPYHADLAWPANAKALFCDVLLTRVNTFGPLHLNPKKQNGIGPLSFRTEGEHFSRACQLWQGGLLNPPTLKSGRWASPLNSFQSNPSAELPRSK